MLKKYAKLFTDLLDAKDLGYNAGNDKDGDSVVKFPYSGKTTKLFFTGEDGEYLSMYLVYEKVPEEKLADVIYACNDLNNRYKWVTLYVDKDRDVVLHNDAILSVESAAEEAFELLIRMIQISDDAKPTIMKAIYA